MVLLGTNDVWRGRKPADGDAAFAKLVSQMRAQKPTVRVLIAKIMNLQPSGVKCGSTCPAAVDAWNKMTDAAAAKLNTAQSPVQAVDCFTGFDIKTDTGDGVHPNNGGGSKKVANCWYAPLAAAIKAAGGTGGGKGAVLTVDAE